MTTVDLSASPALLQWLQDGANFDAEYGDRLSNHLPMALVALHRLGADDARLHAWARGYVARLRPAPAAAEWPAGDAWASCLGQHAAWPLYRHLFGQWLEVEGAGDVLEAVLPRLMQGCAGAAFHGLIRTAYAVQSAWRPELADALAHWASAWQPVGEPVAGQGDQGDPKAVLRALPLPPQPVPGRPIADRVAAVAAHPGFIAAAARLRVDGDTLETLARGAAEMYARSGNFTVLHMLTSAHALRVLLPWFEDPVAAVRAYWPAYAAAWAASGARERSSVAPRPWARITAAAIASDDDHVAKLVDSCREQEQAYGGREWRLAASRGVAAA